MKKLFLRLFSIETLLDAVIDLLTAAASNPRSEGAKRLCAIVKKLNQVTDEFLEKVY